VRQMLWLNTGSGVILPVTLIAIALTGCHSKEEAASNPIVVVKVVRA
jgi:hypothetical protein